MIGGWQKDASDAGAILCSFQKWQYILTFSKKNAQKYIFLHG